MNKRKTSAAIIGLLDALKEEKLHDVGSAAVTLPTAASSDVTPSEGVSHITTAIPYTLKIVPTDCCKPWKFANRLKDYITLESCRDLIDSINKVGQQIPALVRPIPHTNHYELICGARRLFSCQRLGIPIRVAVAELSDKEALWAMDAENRPRADISPYERALDYKQWINAGIYKNYHDIQQEIAVNKSWFSKLIALADLEEEIVKAFGHPQNLKQHWGYQLHVLLEKYPEKKPAVIAQAKSLQKKTFKSR